MKKVLIVSYFFPPVNMIASKRYGNMCKYFEENGYMPYVLTIRQGRAARAWARLDLELPIDKAQIIRSGSAGGCAEAMGWGWGMAYRFLENFKYHSRTIDPLGHGWHEQVKADKKLEMLKDIDIIIGTFPPISNYYIALWLARKLNVPFIAEIRDLVSDYAEPPAGYKPTPWINRIIERNILQKAAAIVPVTSGFEKILKARYPEKKMKVVYNGWDGERTESAHESRTDKYLHYAGTFYPHRLESFRLLIGCLKKINAGRHEKISFIVRSDGPADLTAVARDIVWQEGMEEHVHILDAVSEGIVRQEQEKAYLNIVLSSIHSDDKALMATVPGKVYELLKESAPVLAVVPECSDVAKVLKYTNKGIASIKEKDIIEFIVKKHEDYAGSQKVEFFSRRHQAKRLCRFMDSVLEK